MCTKPTRGHDRRLQSLDWPDRLVRSSVTASTLGLNLFPAQSIGKTWNPHSLKARDRVALPAHTSIATGLPSNCHELQGSDVGKGNGHGETSRGEMRCCMRPDALAVDWADNPEELKPTGASWPDLGVKGLLEHVRSSLLRSQWSRMECD